MTVVNLGARRGQVRGGGGQGVGSQLRYQRFAFTVAKPEGTPESSGRWRSDGTREPSAAAGADTT